MLCDLSRLCLLGLQAVLPGAVPGTAGRPVWSQPLSVPPWGLQCWALCLGRGHSTQQAACTPGHRQHCTRALGRCGERASHL